MRHGDSLANLQSRLQPIQDLPRGGSPEGYRNSWALNTRFRGIACRPLIKGG
jgi:hypothetical protein